jgi:small subunit ribosomal protein S20
MPTHKSAKKRQIQNVKKNAANREARSTIRTAVKTTLELSQKGDKAKAAEAAKAATRLLDKAVSKGLVHKNNAARRVSRLNAKVAKLG